MRTSAIRSTDVLFADSVHGEKRKRFLVTFCRLAKSYPLLGAEALAPKKTTPIKPPAKTAPATPSASPPHNYPAPPQPQHAPDPRAEARSISIHPERSHES